MFSIQNDMFGKLPTKGRMCCLMKTGVETFAPILGSLELRLSRGRLGSFFLF